MSLAQNLLQINAIKISPKNPFTWASGWKSPIYCDNRLALSYPKVRNQIKQGLVSLCEGIAAFDVVVGVATAGIPHGALLADALQKPFCYVRAQPKEHGRQNQIEGLLSQGQRVVIVEDLISTGGSLIRAAQPVRASGAEILHALAIFTYGFPQAEKNMQEAGISYSTLTNYKELQEEALKLSYIRKDEMKTLEAWRRDPAHWQPLS